MTTLGWILTAVLTTLVLIFSYRFYKDYTWNKKLSLFQKTQRVAIPKTPALYWLKRGYGLILSSFAVVTVVASGVFSLQVSEPITYLNAQTVGSEAKLLSLINQRLNEYEAVTDMAPDSPEAGDDLAGEDDRDFIDTNMQVDGVIEADIVKTDGYTIYYATRYQNKVRVIDILPNGDLDVREDIDLGNLYTDAIYITDTQLIVIGYIYQYFYMMPELDGDTRDYYMGGYSSFTGAVQVYDRTTLELEYELETDTNFYQHRLIGDALYLLSNKYMYTNDLTPTFKETIDGNSVEFDLSYDSIYYFEGVPAYSMTVISSLDLSNYQLYSEAFLGQVHQIYASKTAIYTTSTVYESNQVGDVVSNWDGQTYTYIIKYEINPLEKTFNYAASGRVKGYIQSQYWMDEYDDYFRIVTTDRTWSWFENDVTNRLYILETDQETQTLIEVGKIEEGLGKEGEDVKSVRFNKDKVNVTTAITIDPLYTISLIDPANPFILPDPIEEPGFNTYLHVWGEDHQLIGVGFDGNMQLKLGAYDTSSNNPNVGEPLATYHLVEEDEEGVYTYSYSEVLYNPKAIMVDVEKGIFAFPVNTYRYTYNPLRGYEDFAYLSLYYIFNIDFDAENPEDIISDPIILEQDEFMYYSGIDRGVYISFNTNDDDETNDFVMVYTLSFAQIVSYNLTLGEVTSTYTYENMETYNPYIYYEDEPVDGEEVNPDDEVPPEPGDQE